MPCFKAYNEGYPVSGGTSYPISKVVSPIKAPNRVLLRRISCSVLLILCANALLWGWLLPLVCSIHIPAVVAILLAGASLIGSNWILIHPQRNTRPNKLLCSLSNGCELLRLFLISATVTIVAQLLGAIPVWRMLLQAEDVFLFFSAGLFLFWIVNLIWAVFCQAAVFFSGIIRLYIASVQIGFKHRVLGIIFSWIPGLNIYYLFKLIHIAEEEVEFESEKMCIDAARADEKICKTKYPILLVHGIFFRDFRYLNYWGRIPEALERNGAEIYYGEQQSAASIADCGQEIADRIQAIVQSSGCEKVNIIAHSKGGLDSRTAISLLGAAPYVASLTTINTPHDGCLFAEYLLEKIPDKARNSIADTYNATLKKLGDHAPDFLHAVKDLTASACAQRNPELPDMPGVWYQSVMSYCQQATSGRFPLNVSYPLVKHFDGKNDGLVSVESARWGERFTLVEPSSDRGISHGDMIDLNRDNIPGFDVREFYVSLVSDLKARGF